MHYKLTFLFKEFEGKANKNLCKISSACISDNCVMWPWRNVWQTKERSFSANDVIQKMSSLSQNDQQNFQSHADCHIKRKTDLSIFMFSRRTRTTARWSSVCWASFVTFSDKIVVHFLLSFIDRDLYASLSNHLNFFEPKHFTGICFLLLKTPCSLINDEIYDVNDLSLIFRNKV